MHATETPLAKAARRPWPPTLDLPYTSPEECEEAAADLAASESEVEDGRGRVDWQATFDRVETWYRLHLPSDTDAPQYAAIRRAIRRARAAS